MLARIPTLHASSRGTSGAPSIHAPFPREGVHVGRKRVARLTGLAGLYGATPALEGRSHTSARDLTISPLHDSTALPRQNQDARWHDQTVNYIQVNGI
ncbi:MULTISPECIES: IS3 family transposase [unclassified Paraburkholderia]|uniref:IS3 family transposase n=1 Tax=unclassified Paraburkholderia TaxID=2615204 RepID=UPI0038B86744